MYHPALKPRNKALITGGLSGIGLAATRRFAAMGLYIEIIDNKAGQAEAIIEELCEVGRNAGHSGGFVSVNEMDVSDPAEWQAHANRPLSIPDVLMNNAAIGPDSSVLDAANWQATLDTNLWGVIHGTQALAQAMVASGKPGLIINTGSKQGITTPPGNPAYNVSKAGVKVFTEALQHELRNGPNPAVTAHLLIPGFVWTGMTSRGKVEKPDAAWTPEQTIQFLLDSLARGDFYILCPDNDVQRSLDEKRMAWAAGDIIDNRPPLSRWHPDYAEAFKAFVDQG